MKNYLSSICSRNALIPPFYSECEKDDLFLSFAASLQWERVLKMEPIVLLHGLGETWWSLLPLQIIFWLLGYKVHNIHYACNTLSYEDSIDDVADQIWRTVPHEDGIVVIGQSFGGVVASRLPSLGIKVDYAIYICSPLHGARFLNQARSILTFIGGKRLANWFISRPAYDELSQEHSSPKPNHSYNTISFGWGLSNFDGCVYMDETMFDRDNHRHFWLGDHRLSFIDPRVLKHIVNLVQCRA